MQSTLPLTVTVATSSKVTRLAAFLFDLDGTLANTDPFHYRAWKELLYNFGIDIDEKFYKTRISGRLNPAIVQDLLPQLSPEEKQQFIEQKEARFRELAPQLTPLPGLTEVVKWAEVRGLKQAVVTNAPPQNVHHVLRTLRLDSQFDPVVIADELGIGKPDPAPYLHALKQLGIRANQAVAFEDSPSGIRSAVGAGIPTIGIASTQDPKVLYTVGATLVVSDFAAPELWAFLSNLSSAPDHAYS
ncbi:HAD family hydrolase [Leptothermofonsia sp. ETS-13]|uniref:HAD family hydrolase n=1 Tax=Leptothermofonsia sp. ETS-13 TaxID=3035696 RepID=UPI003BA3D7D3